MTEEELIAYHAARAQEEANKGLIAGNSSASRSHLVLAQLHSNRARELMEPGQRVSPILKM